MSMANYVKIFSGSLVEVQLIKKELENVNIIPVIKDENESARLGGYGGYTSPGDQQVYVHNDEAIKALPIVEKLISEFEA